jgi:hypothetical protein
MKKVWKYGVPLTGDGEVHLGMPRGATVVSLQRQRGDTSIWAIVDPDAPLEPRQFRWVGTGQEVGFDGKFVGTMQWAGGSLVFHLFEVVS